MFTLMFFLKTMTEFIVFSSGKLRFCFSGNLLCYAILHQWLWATKTEKTVTRALQTVENFKRIHAPRNVKVEIFECHDIVDKILCLQRKKVSFQNCLAFRKIHVLLKGPKPKRMGVSSLS